MAGVLSPELLTAARTASATLLPDTCTIVSRTRVTNAAGTTYVEATVASNEPCKWAPLSQQDRLLAQQMGSQITGRVRFAYSRTILHNYRIVLNGVTYEVIGVNVDSTWRLQTIADVKLVSGT